MTEFDRLLKDYYEYVLKPRQEGVEGLVDELRTRLKSESTATPEQPQSASSTVTEPEAPAVTNENQQVRTDYLSAEARGAHGASFLPTSGSGSGARFLPASASVPDDHDKEITPGKPSLVDDEDNPRPQPWKR